MNKSNVSGKLDQAVGSVKQAVGEAVGNEKLANKGAAQQVKGEVKETWGNVKDSANEAHATAQTKAHADGHDLRDKVTTAAENAKRSVSEKLDNFNDKQKAKRDEARRAS